MSKYSHRLELYIQHLASGMASYPAAKSAGYSDAYSKVAATRLGKLPAVKAAVNGIQLEGRKMASYELSQALTDCDNAAAFAMKHKNSMALVKARELKSKLAGLLIERVEQVTVDLTAALAEAKSRALSHKNITITGKDEERKSDGDSSRNGT